MSIATNIPIDFAPDGIFELQFLHKKIERINPASASIPTCQYKDGIKHKIVGIK